MHSTAVGLVWAVAVVAVAALAGAALMAVPAVAQRFGATAAAYGRAFTCSALAVLGIAVGFLGALFQAATLHLGGSATEAPGAVDSLGAAQTAAKSSSTSFPVGIIVALLMLVALLVLGAVLLRSPLGVILPGLTWLAVVAVLMYGSDKGDVVLENTATAQVFLYGGLLLCAGMGLGVQQLQLRDQLRAARLDAAQR